MPEFKDLVEPSLGKTASLEFIRKLALCHAARRNPLERACSAGIATATSVLQVLKDCHQHLVLWSNNSREGSVLQVQDLHHDATRDLRALGCHVTVINNCQTLDKETRVSGLAKDMQEGVLFM